MKKVKKVKTLKTFLSGYEKNKRVITERLNKQKLMLNIKEIRNEKRIKRVVKS